MSLAQVVYNISNDDTFAKQWRTNPQAALADRGLELSKEEQAFLFTALNSYETKSTQKIKLAELNYGLPWF
jgi:hypothetical protein